MSDVRVIGKLVLDSKWTVAGALEIVQPQDVTAAIESYENVPALIDTDPDLSGGEAAELRKWLKPIGMTNWPDMPNKGEWLTATMLALSDLPAKVAISAARQAVHRDFRFPNEVKPVIREIAESILVRHRLALHRLKLMRAEIERASQPKLQAPDGYVGQDVPPPSAKDRRKLAGSVLGRAVLDLGLSNGHISQQEYDEAKCTVDTGQG